MRDDNLKDLIKVSEKLDDAVFKGLERGKKEKQRNKKSNIVKRGIKVAGLALVITGATAVFNPELVSAIPVVGEVFKSFNSTLFGEPTDRFQGKGIGVGQSIKNNGIEIALDEVILDENMVMMTLTVEGEFLKGFTGKNERDFINLSSYLLINGEEPSAFSENVRKLDENKAAVILTENIAKLDIGEEANIEFKIRDISRADKMKNGKWDFKLDAKNQDSGKRIKLNNKIEYKNNRLEAKEIIMTDLTNTLIFEGKARKENDYFFYSDYMIRDNNNKYFEVKTLKKSTDKDNNFHMTIKINGDLSNSEYIELIPKNTLDFISKKNDGIEIPILKSTGSENSEYKEKLISRKPTEEELKVGFGLDKVNYYVNIDKEMEFKKLNELVGTSIAVNSRENIIIKDILDTEQGTKIIFESKGLYNYNKLTALVAFDEDMKDVARKEGQSGAAIEDEDKGLYNMTLDKLDNSKKYKIAIPMSDEISNEKPAWSIKINLK